MSRNRKGWTVPLKRRLISGLLAFVMCWSLTSGWLTLPVWATKDVSIEITRLDMATGQWTVVATGPANEGSGNWVLAIVPNVYTGAGMTPEQLIALRQITNGTQTTGQMNTALANANLPAGLVVVQSGDSWNFDGSGKHTFTGTFDTKTLEEIRKAFPSGYTGAGGSVSSDQITDLPFIAMLITANDPPTLAVDYKTMEAPALAELSGTPISGNIKRAAGDTFTSIVSATGKNAELQMNGSSSKIELDIKTRDGNNANNRFSVSWQSSGVSQVPQDGSEVLVLTTVNAASSYGPYSGVIRVYYYDGATSTSVVYCEIPVYLTVDYTYLYADTITITAPYGDVENKTGSTNLIASIVKADDPNDQEHIYLGSWEEDGRKIVIGENIRGVNSPYISEDDEPLEGLYVLGDGEGEDVEGTKEITEISNERITVTLEDGTIDWDTLSVGRHSYEIEIPYFVGSYYFDEDSEEYWDFILMGEDRTLRVPVIVIVEGNTELQAKTGSDPYATSASYTWTVPTTGSETVDFDIKEALGVSGEVTGYTFIGGNKGFQVTHNGGAFTGSYEANEEKISALTFTAPKVDDATGNCSALYRISYRMDADSPTRTLDIIVAVEIEAVDPTSTVTVDVKLDDGGYASQNVQLHKKTSTNTWDDTTTKNTGTTYAAVKFENVPYDTYEIYVGGQPTGVTVVVDSATESADVQYYTITVATDPASGGGTAWIGTGGSGNTSEVVLSGKSVQINASPNSAAGYKFDKWNDNDTNTTRTVQVTSKVTYTARFVASDTSILVKKNGSDWTSTIGNQPTITLKKGDSTITGSYTTGTGTWKPTNTLAAGTYDIYVVDPNHTTSTDTGIDIVVTDGGTASATLNYYDIQLAASATGGSGITATYNSKTTNQTTSATTVATILASYVSGGTTSAPASTFNPFTVTLAGTLATDYTVAWSEASTSAGSFSPANTIASTWTMTTTTPYSGSGPIVLTPTFTQAYYSATVTLRLNEATWASGTEDSSRPALKLSTSNTTLTAPTDGATLTETSTGSGVYTLSNGDRVNSKTYYIWAQVGTGTAVYTRMPVAVANADGTVYVDYYTVEAKNSTGAKGKPDTGVRTTSGTAGASDKLIFLKGDTAYFVAAADDGYGGTASWSGTVGSNSSYTKSGNSFDLTVEGTINISASFTATKVTVNVNVNGKAYNSTSNPMHSGTVPSITLKQDATTLKPDTSSNIGTNGWVTFTTGNNSNVVTAGTYDVYVGDSDTGVNVTVTAGNTTQNVTLHYYDVVLEQIASGVGTASAQYGSETAVNATTTGQAYVKTILINTDATNGRDFTLKASGVNNDWDWTAKVGGSDVGSWNPTSNRKNAASVTWTASPSISGEGKIILDPAFKANEKYSVTIHVTLDGGAVQGALVKLTGPSPDTTAQTAYTDGSGNAKFDNLEGTYSVSVESGTSSPALDPKDPQGKIAQISITSTGTKELAFFSFASDVATASKTKPFGTVTKGSFVDGNYFTGTKISVTAEPKPGYKFTQWTKGADGQTAIDTDEGKADYSQTIGAPTTIFANFVANTPGVTTYDATGTYGDDTLKTTVHTGSGSGSTGTSVPVIVLTNATGNEPFSDTYDITITDGALPDGMEFVWDGGTAGSDGVTRAGAYGTVKIQGKPREATLSGPVTIKFSATSKSNGETVTGEFTVEIAKAEPTITIEYRSPKDANNTYVGDKVMTAVKATISGPYWDPNQSGTDKWVTLTLSDGKITYTLTSDSTDSSVLGKTSNDVTATFQPTTWTDKPESGKALADVWDPFTDHDTITAKATYTVTVQIRRNGSGTAKDTDIADWKVDQAVRIWNTNYDSDTSGAGYKITKSAATGDYTATVQVKVPADPSVNYNVKVGSDQLATTYKITSDTTIYFDYYDVTYPQLTGSSDHGSYGATFNSGATNATAGVVLVGADNTSSTTKTWVNLPDTTADKNYKLNEWTSNATGTFKDAAGGTGNAVTGTGTASAESWTITSGPTTPGVVVLTPTFTTTGSNATIQLFLNGKLDEDDDLKNSGSKYTVKLVSTKPSGGETVGAGTGSGTAVSAGVVTFANITKDTYAIYVNGVDTGITHEFKNDTETVILRYYDVVYAAYTSVVNGGYDTNSDSTIDTTTPTPTHTPVLVGGTAANNTITLAKTLGATNYTLQKWTATAPADSGSGTRNVGDFKVSSSGSTVTGDNTKTADTWLIASDYTGKGPITLTPAFEKTSTSIQVTVKVNGQEVKTGNAEGYTAATVTLVGPTDGTSASVAKAVNASTGIATFDGIKAGKYTATVTNPTWENDGTVPGVTVSSLNTDPYTIELNYYTYSFDPNNSTLGNKTTPNNMPSGSTAPVLKGFQLSYPTPDPTLTGYTFKGWTTTLTNETADWGPAGTSGKTEDWSISAKTTFYAIWELKTLKVESGSHTDQTYNEAIGDPSDGEKLANPPKVTGDDEQHFTWEIEGPSGTWSGSYEDPDSGITLTWDKENGWTVKGTPKKAGKVTFKVKATSKETGEEYTTEVTVDVNKKSLPAPSISGTDPTVAEKKDGTITFGNDDDYPDGTEFHLKKKNTTGGPDEDLGHKTKGDPGFGNTFDNLDEGTYYIEAVLPGNVKNNYTPENGGKSQDKTLTDPGKPSIDATDQHYEKNATARDDGEKSLTFTFGLAGDTWKSVSQLEIGGHVIDLTSPDGTNVQVSGTTITILATYLDTLGCADLSNGSDTVVKATFKDDSEHTTTATTTLAVQTTYIVTLDENQGNPGSPTKLKKKTTDEHVPSFSYNDSIATPPSWDGYVFAGWATTNSASTASWTTSSSNHKPAEDGDINVPKYWNTTVYAVWTANEVTVTVWINNTENEARAKKVTIVDDGGSAPTGVTSATDNNGTVTFTAVPADTTYKILVDDVDTGHTISVTKGHEDLYYYTVTYGKITTGGGTYTNGKELDKTETEESGEVLVGGLTTSASPNSPAVTLPMLTQADNYQLTWTQSKPSGNRDGRFTPTASPTTWTINSDGKIEDADDGIELTPTFEATGDDVTVTIKLDGDTDTDDSTTTIQLKKGDVTYTAKVKNGVATFENITKDTYEIWVDKTGGTSYADTGISCDFTKGNATLWYYTVKFADTPAHGGYGTGGKPGDTVVLAGGKDNSVTLPTGLQPDDHYSLTGWEQDKEAGDFDPDDDATATTWTIDNNYNDDGPITLTPVFAKSGATIKVTVKVNGTEISDSHYSGSHTVTLAGPGSSDSTTDAKTDTAVYEFEIDKAGTYSATVTTPDSWNNNSTAADNSVTVDADFEEDVYEIELNYYTYKFDLNSGTDNNTPTLPTTDQVVLKGYQVSYPAKDPTRTGYNFQGWGVNASSVNWDSSGKPAQSIATATTITAIWDKTGGFGASKVTLTATYNMGATKADNKDGSDSPAWLSAGENLDGKITGSSGSAYLKYEVKSVTKDGGTSSTTLPNWLAFDGTTSGDHTLKLASGKRVGDAGKYVITFTVTDTSNSNETELVVEITVDKATPIIVKTGPSSDDPDVSTGNRGLAEKVPSSTYYVGDKVWDAVTYYQVVDPYTGNTLYTFTSSDPGTSWSDIGTVFKKGSQTYTFTYTDQGTNKANYNTTSANITLEAIERTSDLTVKDTDKNNDWSSGYVNDGNTVTYDPSTPNKTFYVKIKNGGNSAVNSLTWNEDEKTSAITVEVVQNDQSSTRTSPSSLGAETEEFILKVTVDLTKIGTHKLKYTFTGDSEDVKATYTYEITVKEKELSQPDPDLQTKDGGNGGLEVTFPPITEDKGDSNPVDEYEVWLTDENDEEVPGSRKKVKAGQSGYDITWDADGTDIVPGKSYEVHVQAKAKPDSGYKNSPEGTDEETPAGRWTLNLSDLDIVIEDKEFNGASQTGVTSVTLKTTAKGASVKGAIGTWSAEYADDNNKKNLAENKIHVNIETKKEPGPTSPDGSHRYYVYLTVAAGTMYTGLTEELYTVVPIVDSGEGKNAWEIYQTTSTLNITTTSLTGQTANQEIPWSSLGITVTYGTGASDIWKSATGNKGDITRFFKLNYAVSGGTKSDTGFTPTQAGTTYTITVTADYRDADDPVWTGLGAGLTRTQFMADIAAPTNQVTASVGTSEAGFGGLEINYEYRKADYTDSSSYKAKAPEYHAELDTAEYYSAPNANTAKQMSLTGLELTIKWGEGKADQKVSSTQFITEGGTITSSNNKVTVDPAGGFITFSEAGETTLTFTYQGSSKTVTYTLYPKALNYTVTGGDKVWDGTTTATGSVALNDGQTFVTDTSKADDVKIATTGASYAYNTSDVGANRTVSVSGISLTGDQAGFYKLGNQTTGTGKITPAQVTKLDLTHNGNVGAGKAISNNLIGVGTKQDESSQGGGTITHVSESWEIWNETSNQWETWNAGTHGANFLANRLYRVTVTVQADTNHYLKDDNNRTYTIDDLSRTKLHHGQKAVDTDQPIGNAANVSITVNGDTPKHPDLSLLYNNQGTFVIVYDTTEIPELHFDDNDGNTKHENDVPNVIHTQQVTVKQGSTGSVSGFDIDLSPAITNVLDVTVSITQNTFPAGSGILTPASMSGKDMNLGSKETFHFNGANGLTPGMYLFVITAEGYSSEEAKAKGIPDVKATYTYVLSVDEEKVTEVPVPVPGPSTPGPTITITEESIVVLYWVSDYGYTNDLTGEKILNAGDHPSFVPEVFGKDGWVFKGWMETDPTLLKPGEVPVFVDPLTFAIYEDKIFYAYYEKEGVDHSHYVVGYSDGTFRPQNSITRAEVATIIARTCLEGFEEGKDYGNIGNYSDVPANKWYSSAIAYCTMFGVFQGYNDGTFRPNQPITRQELANAVARMAGMMVDQGMPFTDADNVTNWARDGVYTAYANGWIQGDPGGTFRPKDNMTRAEAVRIFNGYLNRGVNAAGLEGMVAYLLDITAGSYESDGTSEYLTWSDVPATFWGYYDVLEASNDHDFHWPDKTETPPEDWDKVYLDEKWRYREQYTVTFDGGSLGTVRGTTSWVITRNNSVTVTPPVEPVAGYTFLGWSETPNGTTLVDPTTVAITGAKTFYAVYEEALPEIYTVLFVSGENGTLDGDALVRTEEKKAPAVPTVTEAEGYTFLGWAETDPALGDPALVDPAAIAITANKTYYAVYEKIQTEPEPEQPEEPEIPDGVYVHAAYFDGRADGTFDPKAAVTRAEVAAMVVRGWATDYDANRVYDINGLTDIADHPYRNYIGYCLEKGIFSGYVDGTFKPDGHISRQEFALALANLVGVQTNQGLPFTDADSIKKWARDGIYTAYVNGWMNGYADGTFRATGEVTRAEAVTAFNNFLGRKVTREGIEGVTEFDYTWTDVKTTNWAWLDIMEATHTHTHYFVDGVEYWLDATDVDASQEQ